jgi:hypothetical protein
MGSRCGEGSYDRMEFIRAFLFVDTGDKDQFAGHCVDGAELSFEEYRARLPTAGAYWQFRFSGKAHAVIG